MLWGKAVNAGQTCIAPDYILASKKVEEKVVALVPKIIKEWYGENPQESPDLCRIVNGRHFNRLKGLLNTTTGTIAAGNYFIVYTSNYDISKITLGSDSRI